MNSTENLLQTITINGGPELRLYDASKHVAGDRWQVCLIAKMDIPLDKASICLDDASREEFIAFKQSLSGPARFEQKRIRNFIKNTEKENVLQDLVTVFLQETQSYLSHPEFPQKFIMKQFNEHMKRKAWKYKNDDQ